MDAQNFKEKLEKNGYVFLGGYYNGKILYEWPENLTDGIELYFKKDEILLQIIYSNKKFQLKNAFPSESKEIQNLKGLIEKF